MDNRKLRKQLEQMNMTPIDDIPQNNPAVQAVVQGYAKRCIEQREEIATLNAEYAELKAMAKQINRAVTPEMILQRYVALDPYACGGMASRCDYCDAKALCDTAAEFDILYNPYFRACHDNGPLKLKEVRDE